MRNKFKKNGFLWLILIISFLALFLRLYRLGERPIALHWDEASWGYNAWSILETGRDEYGQFLPLIFKAFGDYKAPVYVYLTALSIGFFGLTEFAIRFPAALFGSINVFLLFFFVKKLFAKFKGKEWVALFAGIFLAISPWHYDYSHGAWEATILFTFFLLGLIFFFKAKDEKPRFIFFSAFFFGLCFYVYNAAKLILPLTALGLLFFWGRDFFKKVSFKKAALALGLVLVLLLPVIKSTFSGGAGGRLKVMSIFSYSRPQEQAQEIARIEETTVGSRRYNLFHNDFHFFFEGIFLRYLNHFSPRFLFFEGDWSDYRHGVPDFGVLNYLDFFFLGFGAYFLLSRKVKNQSFLWYFLLISPLPAALTRDIIQSLRSFFMVLPLAIIAGFGAFFIQEWLSKKKMVWRLMIGGGAGLGYLFCFLLFWDRYFIHAPIANSNFWQYGYKQAVEFVKERQNDYEKIVFTGKYGQPYIYYLLYSQYPPSEYQQRAVLVEHPEGDVGYVERIDNIEFRNLYWPQDRFESKVLYVGATYEIPDQDLEEGQARVLKDIYFLDGELAFRIAETL